LQLTLPKKLAIIFSLKLLLTFFDFQTYLFNPLKSRFFHLKIINFFLTCKNRFIEKRGTTFLNLLVIIDKKDIFETKKREILEN